MSKLALKTRFSLIQVRQLLGVAASIFVFLVAAVASAQDDKKIPSSAVAGMRSYLSAVPASARFPRKTLWEYDPYDTTVWIAMQPSAEFPGSAVQQFRQKFATRLEAVIGSPLRATIAAAPQAIVGKAIYSPETLVLTDLENADEKATKGDKLVVVSVRQQGSKLTLTSREFDTRSSNWGPTIVEDVSQPALLCATALDAFCRSFRPLFRVKEAYNVTREEPPENEGGEPKKTKINMAVCELRAGLLTASASPIMPVVGDVMQPYIRRNSRTGDVSGVDPIKWTYCIAREKKGYEYQCEVRSAKGGGAVGASGGRRTEQFALVPPVTYEKTDLAIASFGDNPEPLSGYEIWDQNIDTGKADLLGVTDWRGVLSIPITENRPLKLLYVRNGGRLLARLPVAPGVKESVVAELPNDEQRLRAESVVRGFQSRLMDVMALRQVLAVRIRSRIKSGDLTLAEKLLEDFRAIEDKRDMTLDSIRQRQQFKEKGKLPIKIEGMFVEVDTLIDRFLDSGTKDNLQKELGDAQKAAGGV